MLTEIVKPENRLAAVALTSLLLANCLYVFFTNVFPFQDLPQHLTYAKILESYDSVENLFQKYYTLPRHFAAYYTFHYIIAFLGRFGGVEAGFKIFMLVYVVSMFCAFQYCVWGIYPGETRLNLWRGMLFQLTVWNGALGLGLMPFVMSLPFFLLSIGAVYRCMTGRAAKYSPVIVLGMGVLGLSFCHVVSLVSFLYVAWLFFFFRRTTQNLVMVTALTCFFVISALGWAGLSGSGSFLTKEFELGRALRLGWGFDFVNHLFKLHWSNPPVILNFIAWNYVGLYQRGTLLTLMGLFILGGWYLKKSANPRVIAWGGDQRPLLNVWFAVLLTGIFVPWGLNVPDRITFINYRLIMLSMFLLIVNVPGKYLAKPMQRIVVLALVVVSLGVFSFNSYRYQEEARVPLEIVRELAPKKVLVTLMFYNKSQYFAKLLDLTHFLPMYYSIRGNGINQQFWGRFTKHLPIGYRSGMKPSGPPDWKPWEFEKGDLRDADYVLLQKGELRAERIADIQGAIAKELELLYCRGRWCLYKRL